jgi:hypothetical protein
MFLQIWLLQKGYLCYVNNTVLLSILAGQGGKDYLDESLFLNEGIEVIYQENLIKKHTFDEII